MTGMIERVARAIYGGRNGKGCKPWASLRKVYQEPYLKDAIGAIKAMREPTPEILEAMKTNIGPLKEMWRGGIDAALGENK